MWLNSRKYLRTSKKIFFKDKLKITYFIKQNKKIRNKSNYNHKLTPHKSVSLGKNHVNLVKISELVNLSKVSLYYTPKSVYCDYYLNKFYVCMLSDLGFMFITPLISLKTVYTNSLYTNFKLLENSLGLPCNFFKNGMIISNLTTPNKGSIVSSQGTYAVVTKVGLNYNKLLLPSGKSINAQGSCYFGKNFTQKSVNYRYRHITSRVRGVAKNPVDHPNGGRSNTKGSLKTPWGKFAKKNK